MNAESAWIEFPNGERVFFTETCTIGRGPACHVVLATEQVSRRHAVIRRMENRSFEIMDMGSSNGTYVNGQRLSRPAELRNGWIIEIGQRKMVFRTPPTSSSPAAESPATQTDCWLLTIDSTLQESHGAADNGFDKTFESWGERCLRIATRHRGVATRSGQDGWLVHWPEPGLGAQGAAILSTLQAMQAESRARSLLRVAVHFGEVTLRPGPAGVPTPSGAVTIYALQIARLACSAAFPLLISAAAAQRLEGRLQMRPVTPLELQGYRGTDRFYTNRMAE